MILIHAAGCDAGRPTVPSSDEVELTKVGTVGTVGTVHRLIGLIGLSTLPIRCALTEVGKY